MTHPCAGSENINKNDTDNTVKPHTHMMNSRAKKCCKVELYINKKKEKPYLKYSLSEE